MQPIAPLMIEHRLIERLVKLMRQDLERIRANILVDPQFAFVDPVFIDVAVDFLRTYADRCHHGKEEDILFAELAHKELDPELQKVMAELTEEHKLAREYTRELVKAKENYVKEEPEALKGVLYYLDKLTAMYPRHIATEDQHFFISTMSYFTAAEKEAMLARMAEFDQQMIHEKYGSLVAALEKHGTCGLMLK
ncbi:MAG: hemerythrin domain-containing protein [Desulfobaccales bacterium]